ncbi:TPA: P-type conjugative transfer protein TrbL [Photobacterium damselae]
MPSNRYYSRLIQGAFIALFFYSNQATAQVAQDNTLDNIIQAFHDKATAWEPIIQNLTLGLFGSLLTISMVWQFSQMAIKEGTGLVDVIAELTRRAITIGVAIWLFNSAPDLARILINSFVEVGSRISSGAVTFSPSNVFELGLNVISIAWDKTSFSEPANMLMMFFVALIILICFAMMAMDMTVLIVSGYITVSGGIVAMGFLGSEWTRDHALNYFTAVLGIAFKMLVMQLIFIIGYSFIQDWATAINSSSSNVDFLSLVGVCIVFAGMMREIPQIAASLASGRFTMAGGGIQSAGKNIGGAVAGAALLAGGAGVMAAAKASGLDETLDPSSKADNASPNNQGGIDTGQGDDGKAYQAHMAKQAQAKSSTSSDSQQTQSTPHFDSQPDNTAPSYQGTNTGQGDSGKAYQQSKAKQVAAGAAKATSSVAKGILHATAEQSSIGRHMARAAIKMEQSSEKSKLDKQAHYEALHRELTNSLTVDDGNDPNNFRDNIMPARNNHEENKEE